ncbi:MAG: aminotransferase class III-fold pyridoxal phosphate-dependent enzyme [Syntrophales bacterium]
MGRKKKTVAVIQARMNSTRLPGKVLMDIAGRPMLRHVVDRAAMARYVDLVVVATSDNPADDRIVSYCKDNGIAYFRGSESDVLDRFYRAAGNYGADAVVRITADCPLIDPGVMDRVIRTYLEGNCDYVTNRLQYTYPDGLDVEVFSFDALEDAWRKARMPAEREHVTPYFRRSSKFRIQNVACETDLSSRDLRWTVDDASDLEFVRAVYARLEALENRFGMREILELLDREPGLMNISGHAVRNEGYYKSLAAEPPVAPRDIMLSRSLEFRSRAERLIPSCTQTLSKGPTQFVQGVAPVFLSSGNGSHVKDVDGNDYIDFPMALGPVILGHNYPAVTKAVTRQMRKGTVFSLPHPLELELAEIIVDRIPCAEMVRYGKNGSDVTAGAVRLARAYTNRDIIACCGYHGWQDWYIGTTSRNKGVPEAVRGLTLPFEYNQLDGLESIFARHPGNVAAVIMEPVGVVMPEDGFLQGVKDLAAREGALLIFDEVVTGFRLAPGGAQEYFGVTPDLACFGKAMANGYPLSAITGRRDIMKLFEEVFFSFTFGGETLSLAASLATLTELKEKNVTAHLWEQGRKLQDGYRILAREFGLSKFTNCSGLPPRTVITFKDETGMESLPLKSLFQQECLKRGILFSGGHNICYTHSDADIDYTLRVYRSALEILRDAIRSGDICGRLSGEPVKPVFRRA